MLYETIRKDTTRSKDNYLCLCTLHALILNLTYWNLLVLIQVSTIL